MKRIFISMPMNKKTDTEIRSEMNEIKTYLSNFFNENLDFIDSFIDDAYEEKHPGLRYLAKSIDMLDGADLIFMADKWWTARGCIMEYNCAVYYGVGIIGYEFNNSINLIPMYTEINLPNISKKEGDYI